MTDTPKPGSDEGAPGIFAADDQFLDYTTSSLDLGERARAALKENCDE